MSVLLCVCHTSVFHHDVNSSKCTAQVKADTHLGNQFCHFRKLPSQKIQLRPFGEGILVTLAVAISFHE